MKVSEDTLCLSVPRKQNIDKLRAVTAESTGIWRNLLLKTQGFGRPSGFVGGLLRVLKVGNFRLRCLKPKWNIEMTVLSWI